MSKLLKTVTLVISSFIPLFLAGGLYMCTKAFVGGNTSVMLLEGFFLFLFMGILCFVYGLLVLVPFVKSILLSKYDRLEYLEEHGELLLTASILQKVLAVPAMLLLAVAVSKLVTAAHVAAILGSFWLIILFPLVAFLAMISMHIPFVGVAVFFMMFGVTFAMSVPAMLAQLERLIVKRCKGFEFILSLLFLCFPISDIFYLLVTKLDNKKALKQSVIYTVCVIGMLLGFFGNVAVSVGCQQQYAIISEEMAE